MDGDSNAAEVSLSIHETNRLRASLGLKPLKDDKADESAKRKRDEEQRQQEAEKEQRAQAFVAKQQAKKQKHSQDSFLNTRTLAQDDSIDDTLSWVERSRQAEARLKAEKEREQRKKEEEEERRREQMEEDEDKGYSAAELAGMKVKHDYNEMNEGEEVVMTLADKPVLGRKGLQVTENEDEQDELENVLKVEDRKREKARKEANKSKPLWEEDGKKRSLLDKYDEEDADISLQLGAGGNVEAERAAQREDVRRKLQQGGKQLESAAVGALGGDEPTIASDYKTEAEAGGFKKKSKKPKKKLRAKSAELEEEGNTAGLIEALEAEAEAKGGQAAAGNELGSRAAREDATRRAERAATAEASAKRERFEAALAKGNWASEALRPQQQQQAPTPAAAPSSSSAPTGDALDEDEADRELQESLARARRLAAQQAEKKAAENGEGKEGGKPGSSLEELAEESKKKREKDEAELKAQMKAGLLVNDTIEFVRNIQVKPETKAEASATAAPGGASVVSGKRSAPPPPPPPPPEAFQGKQEEGDDYMGLTAEDKEGTASLRRSMSPPPAKRQFRGTGRWVTAEQEEGTASVQPPTEQQQEEDEQQKKRQLRQKREPTPDDTPTNERGVGKGLAGALALLKEKGNVGSDNITWAGRNNDKSKNALQGLGEVYKGGAHDDRLARSIEMALTTKDEFGRVMTPKERFRQLCYEFHGKFPSKNKQETRLQKAAEEIQRRKNATSEVTQHQEVEGLRKATEKTHQPFVVLQGKGAQETLKAATAAASEKAKVPPPPSSKPTPPPPGASSSGGMRRVGGGVPKGGTASTTSAVKSGTSSMMPPPSMRKNP